jgi:gliding motility-associated-like protein
VVNALPTVVANGSSLCKGDSKALTATGAATYTWSPNTAITALTGATVTVNPESTITYTVEATDANGCKNTDTVLVTVKPLPVVGVIGINPICENGTTQLTPATGGIWESSNEATATVSAVGEVTGVSSGTAIFTFTDVHNCKSSTMPVTVQSLPTATISGGGTFCQESSPELSVELEGAFPYTLEYNVQGLGIQSQTVTSTPAKISISPMVPVEVTLLKVTDGNSCEQRVFSTATATVTYHPSPTATITSSKSDYCQEGSDQGLVQITVGSTTPPIYTLVLSRSLHGDTTLIFTDTTYTYPTRVSETYTLKSLTDGNGCISKSTDLRGTVEVNAVTVPVGGGISGNEVLCEGTDTLYSVSPTAVSALPVTYTWSMGTEGARRTGSETGLQSGYRFTSDQTGSIVTGTMSVVASNRCGASAALSKTVNLRLAPRAFHEGDTIHGPKAFCASSNQVKYKLDQLQLGAEGYLWKWDNSEFNVANPEGDTSAVITGWSGTSGATAKVSVELTNRCSARSQASGIAPAVKSQQVTIVKPESLSVLLSSDKDGFRFCEPTDQVVFTATPVSGLQVLEADYTFKVGGKVVYGPGASNQYIAPIGSMKDGDQVQVLIEAKANQCLSIFSVQEQKTLDGYQFPSSRLVSNQLEICEEGEGEIVLSVEKNDLKNYNGSVTWYKSGGEVSAYNGLSTITLQEPFHSGSYVVKVGGSVCPDHTLVDSVRVKIYEKPRIIFTTDPILLSYKEGIKVPIPVTYTTLRGESLKDPLRVSWTPSLWLNKEDILYPTIAPENKEAELEYTVTVRNGEVGGIGCESNASVRVLNMLPLKTPNAFTPNGDGLNDTWKVEGLLKYAKVSLRVFNRWGAQVFQDLEGYKVPWDGTYNGSVLPAGTYYYLLELSGSPDNTDQTISGPLTIVY